MAHWHIDTLAHWHMITMAHYYFGTLILWLWHIITMAHWHTPSSALVTVGPLALAIPIVNEWEVVELSEVPQLIVNSTQPNWLSRDTNRHTALLCWTRAQTDTEWLVVRYLYIVTAHRWTLEWGHWLARDTEDWTLDLLSFVLLRLESGTLLLWGRSHLSVPEYIPPPLLELSRVLVSSRQLSDNRTIVKPLSSGRLRGAAAFSASSWHFVISSIFLLFLLRISSVSQRDCSKSLDIHWKGDASHCLL